MIEEALLQARELAHDNRLEGKDLDELDELEDEEDEDFLDSYRQKRVAEMRDLQNKSVYGYVYPIQKPDYAKDVTEESSTAWVLVLLTSSSGMNEESARMAEIWRELATKFGEVKFCQMQANLCIEGYPDRNTPTVLIYKDGEIKRQLVTLKELNGARTGTGDLEKVLLSLGAVQYGDRRLQERTKGGTEAGLEERRGIRQGNMVRQARSNDEEDSDWD